MHPRPARLTRRTAGGGALGATALGLSGCDVLDDVLGGDDDPGVSGAVTPTAPAIDDDSRLVGDIAAALAAASALATVVGTTAPALARSASRLSRMHEAHLVDLGGADPAPAPDFSGGKARGLRVLRASETDLQQRLVEGAERAGSGALAQVLASMAAAVAQQLVVLR